MARTKKKGLDIEQEYELVDVGALQEHPQNPRRGREDAIAESIDANGWYGAVVAQQSTGYILAGNHRYRVAKKKGAKQVPTIWRDVDDEAALRILLADNRTADLGSYDEELLAEVMDSLDSLDGTGWGLPEVEAEEEREDEDGEAEVPEDVYEPSFGVIVVCDDEAHQEQVYEKLQAEGYQIRVVAV